MSYRTEIREKLRVLKEEYGILGVKAEFEAEGSRKDELIMLREFTDSAGLGLIIKIGGCEAVHDLDQCKLLDVAGVMAPMIETPFAMDKFKGAVKKVYRESPPTEILINAETKTCLQSFDEILDRGEAFLTGVTVGRSDLSASMGIERKDIETGAVFNATKSFLEKAERRNLITNFGGNIGIESIPFIMRMFPHAERFETRKVICPTVDNAERLKRTIKAALDFELLYLQFKSDYYASMSMEDRQRIERLRLQISAVS